MEYLFHRYWRICFNYRNYNPVLLSTNVTIELNWSPGFYLHDKHTVSAFPFETPMITLGFWWSCSLYSLLWKVLGTACLLVFFSIFDMTFSVYFRCCDLCIWMFLWYLLPLFSTVWDMFIIPNLILSNRIVPTS